MKRIDLHVHSNVSDGTYTPGELVEYAEHKGLAAFALTDHDTVDGLKEAEEAAKESQVELVPGIEISSEYCGGDVHILGLYLDYENRNFRDSLKEFRSARDKRNVQMAEKLTAQGLSVTMQELEEAFPQAVITRAHFAKLLTAKGYTRNYEEAFAKYIGRNCPCYVPRKVIKPEDAIRLIQTAKGIPVLAHPLLYHLSMSELRQLIQYLKEAGLEGLEVYYSMNHDGDDNRLAMLAKEYGLVLTGGSDFHGSTKPHIDLGCGRGNLYVSDSLLIPLLELRKKENL